MPKQLKLKNFFFIGNDLIQQMEEEKNEQIKDNMRLMQVEPLQLWLAKLNLHGKASRARTRFIQLVAPRAEEIDKQRVELAQANCKKKKDQIVYLDDNGKETTDAGKGKQFVMDNKQKEKFNKEYDAYLKEELELDITPERTETIYGVRDLIMETEEFFVGMMATRYAEWCKSFEDIK